jgi:hypothetical protein
VNGPFFVLLLLVIVPCARTLAYKTDSDDSVQFWERSAEFWREYDDPKQAARSAALAEFFRLPWWKVMFTRMP